MRISEVAILALFGILVVWGDSPAGEDLQEGAHYLYISGMPCIAYRSVYQAALTCDWSKYTPNEDPEQ